MSLLRRLLALATTRQRNFSRLRLLQRLFEILCNALGDFFSGCLFFSRFFVGVLDFDVVVVTIIVFFFFADFFGFAFLSFTLGGFGETYFSAALVAIPENEH